MAVAPASNRSMSMTRSLLETHPGDRWSAGIEAARVCRVIIGPRTGRDEAERAGRLAWRGRAGRACYAFFQASPLPYALNSEPQPVARMSLTRGLPFTGYQ